MQNKNVALLACILSLAMWSAVKGQAPAQINAAPAGASTQAPVAPVETQPQAPTNTDTTAPQPSSTPAENTPVPQAPAAPTETVPAPPATAPQQPAAPPTTPAVAPAATPAPAGTPPAAPAPAKPAEQAADQSKQIPTAGQMVWVNGSIKATYLEQTPRAMARGSVIYEKDTITSEENSTGQIAFTDNSLVSLRPNTTLAITQYHYEPSKPASGGQYVMELVKGGFRTITGFVAKAQPENYQVKTPVATIGVRGTTFQTNCVGGHCGVGLEKGAGVSVSNAGGSVVLNQDTPYSLIDSSNSTPVLSRSEPSILARPPLITPSKAPAPQMTAPPGGGGKGGGGGGCGVQIGQGKGRGHKIC